VHSAGQFYAIRFFLGVAEASFFPGMIVYLTHWFRLRERSRAIACLYAAVPTASLVGSPLAGWLLGVHWPWLAGWRWLFILEGVPAIVLGIITVFYLTDWPSQAHWLPHDERDWLVNELQAELQAKKKVRDYTILQAFYDRRVVLLIAALFLALSGSLGNIYWIPIFVKRLSGFSDRAVTSLLLVPALIGIAGMLTNGWHSDKRAERRWHTAMPLLAAGTMYGLLIGTRLRVALLKALWGTSGRTVGDPLKCRAQPNARDTALSEASVPVPVGAAARRLAAGVHRIRRIAPVVQRPEDPRYRWRTLTHVLVSHGFQSATALPAGFLPTATDLLRLRPCSDS
jgi:ACS family tartrate transporter-like MFS transporter